MLSFLLQILSIDTAQERAPGSWGFVRCAERIGLTHSCWRRCCIVLQILFPEIQTPVAVQPGLGKPEHQNWLHQWLSHAQNFIVDHMQKYMAGHNSAWVLAGVVAVIPTVMLARCVVIYLYGYLMSWVVVRAIADLRTRAFEHLLNLPLSFFGANSTGELMSRVADFGLLQSVLANSVMVVIKEPVTVLSLAAFMFATQWKLALTAVIFCPLFIIPISLYSKKGRKSAGAAQTNAAGLSRLMHESFTGNRIIKAYNLEWVVLQRFRAETAKYIGHFMRVVRSTETPGPLIEFMGSIGVAALLFCFALQRTNSVGDFATFVFTIFLMYRPIKSLVRLHSQMTQARAGTQRIFALLATESTLKDPPQPQPLQAAGGDIHFDNVSFAYDNKLVLREIQLRVEPGEKWRWWAKAVRAKRPWPTCCSAFTIRPAAPSASPAWTCARPPCATCAGKWRW
jgi:ABC-type multidrug transport system fused ATPase/permease subunit